MHTAFRFAEGRARVYRRTWRGSVFTSFLSPLLLLVAMGVGLGSLVDADRAGALPGGDYLAFLAPGLLAATAMQTAAAECSWPVMAGIKWIRSYEAALATPITSTDLTIGHMVWAGIRVLMVATIFGMVAMGFGALPVRAGAVAILVATLTGVAFVGPITWYTAALESETGLSSLFRFVILPLFLFSGTFFPISQLPDWMEPAAVLVPLWHGVELARSVTFGQPSALPWGIHIGVLIVVTSLGAWGAVRQMRKRLVI